MINQTWFVYMLLCDEKTFYIGITNNVNKRLMEHKNKQSFFTKKFSRLKLVYCEKEFRRSLSVYLRQNLNKTGKSIVFDLKFRKSNKDVLIQLADMIVGSIKRSYSPGKSDSAIYKEIIKKRIEDEWVFE